MNPSSIYKNQIKSKMSASKSKKSTIHIKDIHKLTPIPTAIKLKTPEPLKSHQECSIYEYPILDIVNTNFNLKMKSFTKIAVCPYFVTNLKIDTVFINHTFNIYFTNIRKVKIKQVIY